MESRKSQMLNCSEVVLSIPFLPKADCFLFTQGFCLCCFYSMQTWTRHHGIWENGALFSHSSHAGFAKCSKWVKGPVVLGRAVTPMVTIPQKGRQKKDGKNYGFSPHFIDGDWSVGKWRPSCQQDFQHFLKASKPGTWLPLGVSWALQGSYSPSQVLCRPPAPPWWKRDMNSWAPGLNLQFGKENEATVTCISEAWRPGRFWTRCLIPPGSSIVPQSTFCC